MALLEENHSHIVGKKQFIAIQSAFSNGKSKTAEINLKRAEQTIKNIKWESPLILFEAKEQR